MGSYELRVFRLVCHQAQASIFTYDNFCPEEFATLFFQLLFLLLLYGLYLPVQNMVRIIHNTQYRAFNAVSRLFIRLSIIIHI